MVPASQAGGAGSIPVTRSVLAQRATPWNPRCGGLRPPRVAVRRRVFPFRRPVFDGGQEIAELSCGRIKAAALRATAGRPLRHALRACGVGAGPSGRAGRAATGFISTAIPDSAIVNSAPAVFPASGEDDEADGPVRTPGPVLYRADDLIVSKIVGQTPPAGALRPGDGARRTHRARVVGV
jgi:hypothetical protein